MKQELDDATLNDLQRWLNVKWKRHGEIEDLRSAEAIAALREQVATCKVCRAINLAADQMPDRIRELERELAELRECLRELTFCARKLRHSTECGTERKANMQRIDAAIKDAVRKEPTK